ncbi:MAG: hypothetical protein KUG80_00055 [Gammaproteobacteria bacterium]|nr:hypothetical protein [Gammaproteobacteria bacterium]
MKFNVLLSAAVIAFLSSTIAQAGVKEVSDEALSKVNGQFNLGHFAGKLSASGMKISQIGVNRMVGVVMEDNPYHVSAKLISVSTKLISILSEPKAPKIDLPQPPFLRVTLPYINPTIKIGFDFNESGKNNLVLGIGLPQAK